MSVVADAAAPRPSLRGPAVLISLAGLAAFAFFALAAVPYLLSPAYHATQYAGRRGALLVHIAFGTVALFTGPIQLWLGIADRRMQLHRQLGIIYLAAVAGGGAAAFVVALSPSAGWIFGAGLMGLATAWLTTTFMAFLAIKRSLMEQHKEWMIRSYVVTFAFVFFRIGTTIGDAIRPEAGLEFAQTMAWACWAVPLLVTELILQGRKILRVDPV
jgi:hypothetical protein